MTEETLKKAKRLQEYIEYLKGLIEKSEAKDAEVSEIQIHIRYPSVSYGREYDNGVIKIQDVSVNGPLRKEMQAVGEIIKIALKNELKGAEKEFKQL